MKIQIRKNIKRFVSGCGLVLLTLMAAAVPAYGTNTPTSGVTQAYSADSSVLPGMVVELKKHDSATVIPLASQNTKSMLGIVVPADDTALSLTPKTSKAQQVLVSPSGRYNALVSNENGAVKTGDYLVVSGLSGVSMKATNNQEQVIGRAVSSFDGSGAIGKTQVSDSDRSVAVGRVTVDVQLAANPLYKTNNVILPGFISRTANGVANKEVSPVRIYISLFLLLASFVMAGIMLYGSVQSGIIAVGRNPLAKQVIGRSLLQTIMFGLVVLALGILVAYLILSL